MTSRRESFWDEYVGLPMDEVPKIEPDEYCNAKCGHRNDEGERVFRKYCSCGAGKGRELNEGRCYRHHSQPRTGPANNNSRGELSADPRHYHDRLDEEGKNFVLELTEVLLDRIPKRYEDLDPLDRFLARRIAIKMHIAANATRYVADRGEMETVQVTSSSGATYSRNMANDMLQYIRQYDREIIREIQDLGIRFGEDEANVESLARIMAEVLERR